MPETKHIKWKIKTLILSELERRGASFVENKFIVPMMEDSYRIYELHPDKELDDVVEEVVNYYLEEMFGLSETEKEIMEEEDEGGGGEPSGVDKARELEEQILKVKQKGPFGKEQEVGEAGKVTCKICGARFKVLYPHLIAKHELRPEQYRKMFPDSPLRAGVPEKVKEKKHKARKKQPVSVANFRNRLVVLANNIYRRSV